MKIEIDTGRVLEILTDVGLSAQAAGQIAAGLGAAAFANWQMLAQRELKSTARDYVQGLSLEQNGNVVTISLNGAMPNMIEQGWDGGDMRAWMLKSPKSKATKDGGRYLVVPFRHGVPGTGGRNVGAAMPPEIHNVAKRLFGTKAPVQGSQNKTVWGGRLTKDAVRAAPFLSKAEKAQVRAKLDELKKPWHTTSVWTGMVRNEAKYAKTSQSSYWTFRTISTRGDPRSWIHPGIVARNFAAQVQGKIADSLAAVMAQALRGSNGQQP